MRTHTEMWTYRTGNGDTELRSADITGFEVEALDGGIGKVDEASYDVGASEIVVDTGPWIFGKKVLLPAGVVQRVDAVEEKVFVNRTKQQIKDAPELSDEDTPDEGYRDRLGEYYGPDGAGWRDYTPHM
jgi:hypothetical protein